MSLGLCVPQSPATPLPGKPPPARVRVSPRTGTGVLISTQPATAQGRSPGRPQVSCVVVTMGGPPREGTRCRYPKQGRRLFTSSVGGKSPARRCLCVVPCTVLATGALTSGGRTRESGYLEAGGLEGLTVIPLGVCSLCENVCTDLDTRIYRSYRYIHTNLQQKLEESGP